MALLVCSALVLVGKCFIVPWKFIMRKGGGRGEVCCCQLSPWWEGFLQLFSVMKGEGRPRGLAESATEIQSHRVRLSEIPSNNIPAFTFHKSDSRAGWYLHPNGPAEFSDVGRKFLFGQIKTQSDVLGLQGDEKLEMGWKRQRKLQGEGGKRRKKNSQEQSRGWTLRKKWKDKPK